MTPLPFTPSRMMLARSGLEDLSTRCLKEGVTAALILSGNEPEKASWELAANREAMREVRQALDRLERRARDRRKDEAVTTTKPAPRRRR